MTANSSVSPNPLNWKRIVSGGILAGLVVNAFEYGDHRIYFDDAWTAAFRALGKTHTGWSTFIPANFLVGILLVWLYARLRQRPEDCPAVGNGNMGRLLGDSAHGDHADGAFPREAPCHGRRAGPGGRQSRGPAGSMALSG